jgi:predicted transcriptional regulator
MAHIASDGTGILERWTVQRIANACHINERTARRAITELTQRGLVLPLDDTAKIRRGHAQSYRIPQLAPHHIRTRHTQR